MKKTDVEKKLIEKANEVKMRDFEDIWQEIKGEVAVEVQPKKNKNRKWLYSLASLAACLILFCCVGIPLLLNNQNNDIVYFDNELTKTNVEKLEFFEQIENTKMKVVSLKRYNGEGFYIYKTSKGVVKGGNIEFVAELNSQVYLVGLKFYSLDVKEKEEISYPTKYNTPSGASLQYTVTDIGGAYNCDAKGTFNSVNYYFTITATSETVTPFFDEFFTVTAN